MKRISVTTLEKFRRYMTEASSFDTEEALIESLKGIFKGNDKTDFGGAYHKIIEGVFEDYSGNIFVRDNKKEFVFNPAQARPALEYRRDHPRMVHEMDVRKIYTTAFGDVQVTGRVDGIEGAITRDVKTRFKSMNDEEYRESAQWKFYLDMLESDVFFYDVFEIKGFDALPIQKPYIMPDVIIIPHPALKCERYESMKDDIEALLNDFMGYIDNRNFYDLLKPAIINETETFIF